MLIFFVVITPYLNVGFSIFPSLFHGNKKEVIASKPNTDNSRFSSLLKLATITVMIDVKFLPFVPC